MSRSKEIGQKAEYWFISKLNEKGIPHQFIDDWYDFDILNQKVELKSCRISIKGKNQKKYRKKLERYQIGRYDFTDKQRESLKLEKVWVCFLVRHEDQFMIMGFLHPNQLNNKRYINLHKLRDFDLISLDDWIQIFSKKN